MGSRCFNVASTQKSYACLLVFFLPRRVECHTIFRMSVALSGSPGLQAAAPFELHQPADVRSPALDGLCDSLLSDLSSLSGLGAPESSYTSTAPAASNLSGATLPLSGLHTSTPANALAQLAALQQQQQLAATLQADPLVSLTNLLAAQQGLNARVAELLTLKQQLAASSAPPRPGGGLRGTGPLANPLYK